MMKRSFLLTLSLIAVVVGGTFAPGRAVTPRRLGRATQTISEKCDSQSNIGKVYCGSDTAPYCDATQLFVCSGVGRGLTFSCSGALPYCIETTPGEAYCSSVQGESCEPAQPDFECTGKGVFPDALNCKKYYYCYENGLGALAAQPFECENLYVFDPSAPNNEYCRLVNNDQSYCTQISCDGTVKNVLMSYRNFPTRSGEIVASCREDKKPLYVFRCGAGFKANLNTLPVQCDLVCTRDDKQAYPGDSTKYYHCVYNGRIWESKVKSCFRGFYFDAKLKQCVVNPTTAAPTTNPPTTLQ